MEVLKMFEERQTSSIKAFLKKYGIYVPAEVKLFYVIEKKGKDFAHVHIYLQGFPIKILVTVDLEKGEVTVDWIEVDR